VTVVAAPPLAPQAAAAPTAPEDPLADLEARCSALDTQDYFEVLGIPRDATQVQLKKAFHQWSRTVHPDRFNQHPDPAVKAQVSELYKRITEAYFVLRDDVKRQKYLQDIQGPERASRLRFTEQTESEVKAQQKKQAEDQVSTNPKARQFYAEALKDLEAGRQKDAERNLKTALMYDPQNAQMKEKLASLQGALDADRDRNNAFQIK
jgi:curved DNA-binding protein CbpA